MKQKIHQWADSRLFLIYIWLCLGFSIGTIFLLFPVRWWVTITRQNTYAESVEKTGVILLIIILLVSSFWLSRKWYYFQLYRKQWSITLFTGIIPLIMALAAVSFFMNPKLLNRDSQKSQLSYRFAIGPYPDEEKIKSLKAEGYTGIISLLHPAVVPFEPVLLQQEISLAEKYNIALIQAPMLPWVSDNKQSLSRIEGLIKKPKGRYYIHCYLGKDRVNLVRNLIQNNLGKAALKSDIRTSRTFEEMGHFERGELFKLGTDIYYTPFPTDEEYLSFILAAEVKSVVNLMDSANTEHRKRIHQEKQILKNSAILFRNYKLNTKSPNVKLQLQAIVDSILTLPKPIVVHHWNSSSPEAVLFIRQFSKHTGQQAINLDHHVSNR